jgi:hypothetical protein
VSTVLRLWLWAALSLVFLALCYDLTAGKIGPDHVFLWTQDLPVIAAEAVALSVAVRMSRRFGPLLNKLDLKSWMVFVAAGFVVAVGGLGARWVFSDYGVSADEFLADFDAKIISSGAFAAHIPDQWRAFAPALQPKFMVLSGDHSTWSSGYLPINAMFRALADAVHLRSILNPAFSAVAILLTWRIGLDLWPSLPRRAIAASLLMPCSSQLLVMSMTSWAAPAHLALNMIWLWLFLRRRPSTDVAAIVVSLLATGLHQSLFHPLFAMPFVAELWLGRQWRRASVLTAALVVVTLFWLSYWRITVGLTAAVPGAPSPANVSVVTRAIELLVDFKFSDLGLFAANLLRFLAWQNLITVPLALIGVRDALERNGPLRAMAVAVCIAPIVFIALIPTQTHGWGYRYLHGYLGCFALLALSGWIRLSANLSIDDRQRGIGLLGSAATISSVFFFSFQAYQAHRFNQPYAAAHKAIQRSDADVVLVDNLLIGFDGGGLVRNDPFLTNRPKVMLLELLGAQQQADLCRRGTVAMFDASEPALKGITTWRASPVASKRARELFTREGCLTDF